MIEIKYCPNCLEECQQSSYGGYACYLCGVLQYATSIVLDTPDPEKSKQYKLGEYLKKIVAPHITYQDGWVEKISNDIKELLK